MNIKAIGQASLLTATFLLFTQGCFAQSKVTPHDRDSDLIIEGKVLALEGYCSALKCFPVIYTVDTSRLIYNKNREGEYGLLTVFVCGESGLLLGDEYRFVLTKFSKSNKKADNILFSEKNEKTCQYAFASKGAVAKPRETK